MMKSEFENCVREFASQNDMLAATEVKLHNMSTADYQTVEFVYTYHPSIPDVGGKLRIAALFFIGGMRLIHDMVPTAKIARDLQLERDKLAGRIQAIDAEMSELRKGGYENT